MYRINSENDVEFPVTHLKSIPHVHDFLFSLIHMPCLVRVRLPHTAQDKSIQKLSYIQIPTTQELEFYQNALSTHSLQSLFIVTQLTVPISFTSQNENDSKYMKYETQLNIFHSKPYFKYIRADPGAPSRNSNKIHQLWQNCSCNAYHINQIKR